MAQTRQRRSPLRDLRLARTEDPNVDLGLNRSFTSMDEHVIRMRTLRNSPRRSSILSSGEISLLSNHTMSSDSSLDISFDTSFDSDVGASTPVHGHRDIHCDKIRKRLVMNVLDDSMSNSLTTSPSKRKKVSQDGPSYKGKLSGLTQDQLVDLLDTLAKDRPDIQKEIEKLLPEPDISPLLENLEYFRHSIYKSLPHSKFGSGRDAFCFRRVKTHIDNFKDTCIKQGKQLLLAESWEACTVYCIKAVDYIGRLPDWDNTSHNKTKQQCFRGVASMFKSALKQSSFDYERYLEIKTQIQEVIKLTKDFSNAIDIVDKKIEKCE